MCEQLLYNHKYNRRSLDSAKVCLLLHLVIFFSLSSLYLVVLKEDAYYYYHDTCVSVCVPICVNIAYDGQMSECDEGREKRNIVSTI